MKFTSKALTLALISCNYLTITLLAADKVATANTKFDVHADPTKPSEPSKPKAFQAKQLKAKEMKDLNALLADFPKAIMPMDLATHEAVNILKQFSTITEDPKVISEKIDIILKPVKEFFKYIKMAQPVIIPLVQESLHAKLNATPPQHVHLLDYITSKEVTDPDAFFKSKVHSKAELKTLCMEFITFFKDIRASIDPKVIELYNVQLKKLTNK